MAQDPYGNQVPYSVLSAVPLGPDDFPQPDPGGGKFNWLILAIVVPLLAVLSAGVFYLCWKNRKLTKELDIEMHDVPKAAVRKAVRGPQGEVVEETAPKPSKQTEKYSQLLTEDEEYAPPEPQPTMTVPEGEEPAGQPQL